MNTTTLPVGVAADEAKTTAIVSYLTLVGFVVAVVLHNNAKTRLGAFHLRQSLGLMLTSIAAMIAGMVLAMIPILGWLADLALWIALVVFWVMGLVGALKGEFKPLPLIGGHFQRWFGTAFE